MRKLALLFGLFSGWAFGAIAVDASNPSGVNCGHMTTSPTTCAYTVGTAGNPILVVSVYNNNGGTGTATLTYNGVSMTDARSGTSSWSYVNTTATMFYLVGPPTGSSYLLSLSGMVNAYWTAASFTGVAQTGNPVQIVTGTGTFGSGSPSSPPASVSMTTMDANSWIVAAVQDTASPSGVSPSVNLIADNFSAIFYQGPIATPGANSIAATGSYVGGTTMNMVLAELQPYSVPACVITTFTLPNGSIGTAYSQTVTTSNCTSPVFSITAGSLPSGLAINSSTGVISGTPVTNSGLFSFTVGVTSTGTGTASQALSIGIPPVISAASIVANSPWSVKGTWTTNIAADSTISCGAVSGGPYSFTSAVVTEYPTWAATSHSMASNPMPNGTYYCIATSASGSSGAVSSAEFGPIALSAPASSKAIALLNAILVRSKLGDRFSGINGAPQTGQGSATDSGYHCWASDGNTYALNPLPFIAGPAYPSYLNSTNDYAAYQFTDAALTAGSRTATAWNNGINNLGFDNSTSTYFNTYLEGLGSWSCIGIGGSIYNLATDNGGAHGIYVTRTDDYFTSTLSPQHNVGPATNTIANLACSGSGSVTATSALNITDVTTTGTNGLIQDHGSVAITVEGAAGTGVNGVWGVTGATSAGVNSTISWTNTGNTCTGWSWTSGGTIHVYGWDIPSAIGSSVFGGYPYHFFHTDAGDYLLGTPWAGMDGFVYAWGIFRGSSTYIILARMRIEDLQTQDLTKSQCFSGPQTDAAGFLNSNWGGTCTPMNPSYFYLEAEGRGGATPQSQYLTAQHRYAIAYQLPGGAVDSNSVGIELLDGGAFPWSQATHIGLLPRTPNPYFWSGPEYGEFISSSQSSSGGVTTINLSDDGGNFGGNANPSANGYDFYTTRGLMFGPKATASTVIVGLPGEIANGLDLAYNFDLSDVGGKAVINHAPSDAAQKWAYVPSNPTTLSQTNPLFIDGYGMWMFANSTVSLSSGFPTTQLGSTQAFTTPYVKALSESTVVDCFGPGYPAAEIGAFNSGAIAFQKSGDLKIAWHTGNNWTVTYKSTSLGDVPITTGTFGCIAARAVASGTSNIVTVYNSGAIPTTPGPITPVLGPTTVASGQWGTNPLVLGDSSNSYWGEQSLVRVWSRALSDAELVTEMTGLRKLLASRGAAMN